MPLEMRQQCERCSAPLAPDGVAFVCVFECTYCAACTNAMQGVCPNCGGELVRRPRRGRVHPAGAGEPVLAPPDAMITDGVPPIPARLAAAVQRHADFRGATFLAWHPSAREMLVTTRSGSTQQLHWLASPGGARTQLTFFDDPVTVATVPPFAPETIVLARDHHGDEFTQLHRLDLSTRAVTQLTPGGRSQCEIGPGAHRAGWVACASTQRNGADRDVWVIDTAGMRCVMQNTGGGWLAVDVSPDDRLLLVREYVSIAVSALWTVDVATGERRLLTPEGEQASYDHARFTPDGAGVLAATTRDSEFQRLERLDLATGAWTALSAHVDADVEALAPSDDGALVAYVTNEAGVSVLRVRGDGEHVVSSLPAGVITGVAWRPRSHEVACTVSHSDAPADVYSYDADTRVLTRWTASEVGGHPRPTPPRAELIRWRSFDEREMTGFLYRPAGAPRGARLPVLIWIHGGPESQIRPEYRGGANAYVDELGAVAIYPNVRGSTGFGRTFVALDDGRKREDSVRDIGALLDWIAQQPDLDAERVMIAGRSYGGYMTLACAVHFSDRVRCFAEAVGISNFVTFLENTEAYRRDLRRVEYGDERDPEMRAFLESISPLTHVARMTRPMLIAQGKNDPRVPVTESEQMVAALRTRGAPVWFLLATDEGHGFHKKANDDFLTCAILAFARAHLL